MDTEYKYVLAENQGYMFICRTKFLENCFSAFVRDFSIPDGRYKPAKVSLMEVLWNPDGKLIKNRTSLTDFQEICDYYGIEIDTDD